MISEFVKEKVFWTRKMNLKLVKFIENKPHMWNPKHPKYTSTEFRDITYAEFAAKYNNEFSGQAVKDRWTNIRSTFANYLRKMNTASEDGQEYKVNWHLWEACQFLLKVHRKIKNEPTLSNNNSDNERLELGQEMESEMKSEETLVNANEIDNLSRSTSTVQNNMDCDTLLQGLVSVFKGVQSDAFGLGSSKYGKVGRTITRKLAKMNSYEAAKTSQRIMEILTLYDENNPDNPNNFKDIT